MKREVKDLWRPVFEQYAAAGWGAASFVLLFAPIPYKLILVGICCGLTYHRISQAIDLYRFRLAISGQQLSQVSIGEMIEQTKLALSKHKGLWLGRGFGWSQRHAQIAKDVLARNPDEIPTLPTWVPDKLRAWLLPKDTVLDPHAILGASWIHGIEPNERGLFLPFSALPGHTLIVGTTRSGKTRLYELLSFQAIHCGGTVLVFDPKGDKDWEERLRRECQRCGRDFLYFHLAFPSKSIRINPLATWNNASEIASRVSQLLGGDAGGDSFVDFADLTISRIVNGLVMIGVRPNLKNIKHYVENGVDTLLEQCFQTYFVPREGTNWDVAITPYMQKAPSRIHAMGEYYREKYVKEKGESDETLSGLLSTLTHDREHFGKMILRLLPLLQRLATGDLGDLLSPDVADFEDTRPIYSMEKIIADRKVLYVGADTLSNKMVGSATISMMLADVAAVAGGIYNFTDNRQEDVYLFMDEAAEGLNDQAIQILNKAGGAGFKAFIATQTIADIEVRLGKKPKALQVLGNTNNVICLRVRDYETAKMIAEMMGETAIQKISVSHNLGSETEATVMEFRGSVTRSMKEEKAPLVSPDVLTRLPNLQYIAMVAGGTIIKGRLPIIGK